MKECSQVPDFKKSQQNSKLAPIASDAERCDAKAVLSDDELGLVSGAGDACVPTMNPEVMLGRHNIPADAEEHRP